MQRLLKRTVNRHVLRKYVLPVAAIALAIVAAVAIPLLWSKSETDRVAFHRQQSLVNLAVSRLQSSIAHDQESSTVWDDAVRQVRKPNAEEWIDANLGVWMHTYFGHDGAFVLD